MSDAVVVGAGPNGLVAANLLAERGWDVVVLEAAAEPGGAVRDAEWEPGCRYDLFSGFYPLVAASPVMSRLGLERWGLRWRHAPLVLGHPFPDGRAAVLSTDLDATCRSLDSFGDGQGERWRAMFERWRQVRAPLLRSLLAAPFPPVAGPLQLLKELGAGELLAFARFAMLPVRRLCEEEKLLDGATMLLAGNALHSDLTPDLPLSGLFGWLLAMLGQDVGFPVPEGGSGALTAALVARLESYGGRVVCGARVARIDIQCRRARAAITDTGESYPARRAVIADVVAPVLYRQLVGEDHLPARLVRDLDRFQVDDSTFKVDWLLDEPVPWQQPDVVRAGTVHVADSLSELAHTGLQLADRLIPDKPFVVVGQSSVADPTRTPDRRQLVWGYTHVPQHTRGDAGGDLTGAWTAAESDRMADRLEARIEALAPGFRGRILARRILSPGELADRDANLVGGAINGGTAALHQQLVFRPTPGLGRPQTPVRGLFLASASAHPGGGVHGACGANAARAAVVADRAGRTRVLAGVGMAAATVGMRARR
ncbi:MAG TPA: NAD(P)/FAD-dependent oxidoreductase [Mycobacteriales bacterium]|nr:NAD(P)/FAD-dependent oxidoreductase [Mycobacteriales bacterium]HVU61175.1 NAD(P)/FAD-dependent oxidoreductase [Mycobacteriales bacterium]